MGVLTDLRLQLVADLDPIAGVPIHPSWPDVIEPPCGFVTPPVVEDWATRGPNFGQMTVALEVVFLVDHGDPAAALAALEDIVEAALPKVDEWDLLAVEAPTPTTVNEGGAEYLASVIRVSKPVDL